MQATAGAIEMANGAIAQSGGGNIRYAATGAITVGLLDARNAGAQGTWGSVSIVSGAAITDNAETDIDVYANALRLNAVSGIATGGQHLETEAVLLSADAGTGGMYLDDATALEIGATAIITVNRVGADGVSVSARSDLAQQGIVAGTQAVVGTTAGALLVSQAVTAAGNLALSAGGDLDVDAAVASTGGAINLAAGGDLLQGANVTAQGLGKTIELVAAGDIVMAGGTQVTSNDANIALVAGGDLALSLVNAGTAGVRASGASITDGDADTDIVAGAALLTATGGIGAATDAIELSVGTLSADAGTGGLFLAESNGLVIDSVSIAVDGIAATGVATTRTAAVQDGLQAGGAIVLTVNAGGLTLTADTGSVTAGGAVLLDAAGAIVANAALDAGSHISVVGTSITQAAAGDFVSEGGTIDVQATAGAIEMANGAIAQSGGGNIRYAATGAITVGLL
ncbi:MAG: hypothetical protein EOO24_45750, partial [Comamonadaceae bacterium]